MKMAIITSYSLVDTNASTERLRAYCNVLNDNYDLVTCSPDSSCFTGTRHVSVGYSPDTSTFGRRTLTEIRYLFRCLKLLRNRRFDYLLASCPSIFLMLLALFKKQRVILDFRDLTWEYLPDSLIYNVVKKVFRFLCRLCARSAHIIVVTNDEEQNFFNQLHPAFRGKVIIIRNGISRTRFEILNELTPPPITDTSGPVSILFCGNVSEGRGLDALISSVGDDYSYKVNIVGDGNYLQKLKQIVHNSGYENIFFWGPVDWSEVVKHYRQNHILYANLSDNFLTAMPSKLYEYLSMGHPVLFGGSGIASEFLKGFSATYVVDPDSPTQIKSTLKHISANPAIRSAADRKFIESNFIREQQAKQLDDFLEQGRSR